MAQRKKVISQLSPLSPLRLEVSRSIINKGGKLPSEIDDLVREMLEVSGIQSGNYCFHVLSSTRNFQNLFEKSIIIMPDGDKFSLTVTTSQFRHSGFFTVKGSRVERLIARLKESAESITKKYKILSSLFLVDHEGQTVGPEPKAVITYHPGGAVSQQKQIYAEPPPSKWFKIVCELEKIEQKFAQLKGTYEKGSGSADKVLLELERRQHIRGGQWGVLAEEYRKINLLIISESLSEIRLYLKKYRVTLTKREELELIKISLK